MNIDPKQLAAAKEIGKHVEAKIMIDKTASSLTLTLTPIDGQGAQYTSKLLSQMASGLATQLKTFFDIKGKMITK